MDSLRGHFPDPDGTDTDPVPGDDATGGAARTLAGGDERRMQVRAYNFWAALLANRTFPDIADLQPERLQDFGPHSVLLDFTKGHDDPAIAYLGAQLAEECGTGAQIARLSEVPARSLLSRITDHYLQIIANQAPIGFEAEFVNQRGATILYRGILLPFSRDDRAIDYIYGVINWKELADQAATDRLMQRVDEAVDTRPAFLRDPFEAPLTEWADGPVDFGTTYVDAADGPCLPAAGLPTPVFGEAPAVNPEMGLADWLDSARELALVARGSEERTRQALYAAIGRAYDFALAAAEAPDDLAELLQDAGIRTQERAPLVGLVKLVFGADYDKTRLTEFATALAHGQRLGLPTGGLAQLLAGTPGGLKAVIAQERALRRGVDGLPALLDSAREQLECHLRAIAPQSLASLAVEGQEFTVLVARRLDDGEVVLLGEIADDADLLSRAARHLLG